MKRDIGHVKYLVNLPPLSCLFFHKPRVDAGHDFVEVLTIIKELGIDR